MNRLQADMVYSLNEKALFLFICFLFPLFPLSSYYSNPLIHLYHNSSYVEERTDCLLLHSEHAPTLLFLISGIECMCFPTHFLALNFLQRIVESSGVRFRVSNLNLLQNTFFLNHKAWDTILKLLLMSHIKR